MRPTPLFLPVKEGQKTHIGPQTISNWVKNTITLCYQLASEGDLNLMRIRPHQLRGLATSWSFAHSLNIQQILEAASWASHNSFTSFYLTEFSEKAQDEMYQLGPLVTAQQIVQPPAPQ